MLSKLTSKYRIFSQPLVRAISQTKKDPLGATTTTPGYNADGNKGVDEQKDTLFSMHDSFKVVVD
jgi:hypothetical protein